MKDNIYSTRLRLNLNDPDHEAVYSLLKEKTESKNGEAEFKSITEYIVHAILFYEKEEPNHYKATMIEKILEAIDEYMEKEEK